MSFSRKDLLGLKDLTNSEMESVLQSATSMKEIITRQHKKLPTLKGFSLVNLFYESSTRTRASFELAGKYLGADTINISSSSSSVTKGETLIDTGKTIEAMGVNAIVIRHPMAGAPELLAKNLNCSILNAGDGFHEHPTQALLDMFTILEHKQTLQGLKVAIVGDIHHSRVARSNIWGLTKMGANVALAGPGTFLDKHHFAKTGATCHYKVEDALDQADVVMALRVQSERQGKSLLPSLREYANMYCINEQRLKLAKSDALLMHPGPINRGIELDGDMADSCQSLINEQVTGGAAIRMALLYHLSGGVKSGNIA